jgi:hypothetical protein
VLQELFGVDLGNRDGIHLLSVLIGDRHHPAGPVAIVHQFAGGKIARKQARLFAGGRFAGQLQAFASPSV